MKLEYWVCSLLILLAVILISGCTRETVYVCSDGTTAQNPSLCPKQSAPETKPLESEQPKYSDCDNFLSKQEKRSCKREIAIAIGDMSYCLTAYNDDKAYDDPLNINNCLDSVFLENREKITFSDCEYYQWPYKVEECKEKVIVLKKEPTLCETFSDTYNMKDDCYSKVAIALRDKGICNNIKNVEDRYECVDEITKWGG